MSDKCQNLQHEIVQASENNTRVNIRSGGSKSFLGVTQEAQTLDVQHHSGVISYEPTELVITARSGTPLSALNATLSEKGQWLAFEPPEFGTAATIGGTVACALAGPARPYLGGARDYILGCRIINGRGEILQFGGEVMKNVAGYDVSRLMTGAMGTLGVLLDVSIKVLPMAPQHVTLAKPSDTKTALDNMQALAGMGLPVTASAYIDGIQYTRLSGTEKTTSAAAKKLEGDVSNSSDNLWHQLREHELSFFAETEHPLWRISVPALVDELDIDGRWLYDWAGMQRWLISDAPAEHIREITESVGGHATLYRAPDSLKATTSIFHPLPAPILSLHKRLKNEFDPKGLFNPQRMYKEF